MISYILVFLIIYGYNKPKRYFLEIQIHLDHFFEDGKKKRKDR